MVESLVEISRMQGEISAKVFSLSDRLFYRQQSLAESAHFSTKIEGNQLTLKQVTETLGQKTHLKASRELKEVINYAKARQFIFESNININKINLLKSHDILLTGILLKSIRGKYRQLQNAIKDSKTQKVIYLPPEWTDVEDLMKNLFKIAFLKKPSIAEAVIDSGIFHFHFESIHPFLDGNGRLGRLWSTNILRHGGLSFVEFVAFEKYHELNRKTYYEQLHALQGDIFYNISARLDLTPWLEYWIKGLLYSIKEAYSRIENLSFEKEELFLEKRLSMGINLFKSHKKISAEQYQLLANIGRTQAVEDLNKLIHLKIIKKIGGGRSTVYILME